MTSGMSIFKLALQSQGIPITRSLKFWPCPGTFAAATAAGDNDSTGVDSVTAEADDIVIYDALPPDAINGHGAIES